MANLTERQIWEVMRSLVSAKNQEIKKTYSSSVYSRVFNNPNNRGLDDNFKRQKANNIINQGMKDINVGIGRKLHERDIEGFGIYKDLVFQGKKWHDYLSSSDLFHLFVLQNNLLQRVNELNVIHAEDVVKATLSVPTHLQFTGLIEYSGKPPKVKEDKVEKGQPKFDPKNPENIDSALLVLSERAHNVYREYTRRSCREFTEDDLEYFNFGEYSGSVARAFIKAKEAVQLEIPGLEEYSFEEINPEDMITEKMVGFDEQGTPVIERRDLFGNVDYFTRTNGSYAGPLFGRDEQDKEIFLGEVGVEESTPTDESVSATDPNKNPQIPLFKPDVEQ